MRITRTLAATLVLSLAVIVAPAAQSQPHDTHAPVARAQPSDMHASVALAAAASRQRQDLRGPDALDAAVCPRNNTAAAAGGSSQRPTTLVADAQPAAPASSTDDDRANGLGAVACLLVIGGLAALYGRRGHRSQRLRANH
jgi:hypothetical protein